MIAVVLVRGTVRARPEIKRAVAQLKLKKNHAEYLEEKPDTAKILRQLENYATWGKTNEKIKANKPPKGGYRHIKKSYKKGGALGNRGEKILELLRNMS